MFNQLFFCLNKQKLLCGEFPFECKATESNKKLHDKIKIGKYKFTSHKWQTISYLARSLINKLLNKNVKQRFNGLATANHKWFQT